MTTLAQVRDGIETRLKTINGLRVYSFVPGDVQYPAAIIHPPTTTDYRDDLDLGGMSATFTISLLIPANVDRKQLDLYKLLERTGVGSVFAAIEADRKLGFVDVDARVVSATDPLEQAEMATTKVYVRAVTVNVFLGG